MSQTAKKFRRDGRKSLALAMLAVFCAALLPTLVPAPEANAQGIMGALKSIQGTSPGIDQNGEETTAWANRCRYFDRNPWAKGCHDDDKTEDVPGTKNQRAVKALEAFPMPVAFNTMIPEDSSGARWRLLKMPGVLPTKIQQRDIGNITRNYRNDTSHITDQSLAIHFNQALSKMQEKEGDPEQLNWNMAANANLGAAGASNSSANVGEQSLTTALDRIMDADMNGALINVANEAAGTGGNPHALFRGIPDAVGMVMRMYKNVFVPMAVLFLLPGAVISQVKGMVGRSLSNTVNVPESQHPFDGILRSIVAVFLIPATQVIMSWSIDVGNSLAYSMKDWVDIPMILNWCRELSYDTKPQNFDNAIKPPEPKSDYGGGGQGGSGGGGGGQFAAIGGSMLGSIGSFLGGLLDAALGGWFAPGEGVVMNMKEGGVHMERQGFLDVILQLAFNFMLFVAAAFIVIMCAFQITIMCYLFLLGPLAAAFYAWPQVNSGKVALFRGVFGNWLEAVIKVSLWRFYWMVVLAVVTQRLIYTGGGTGDLQWEVAMFASFLGIMLYVPQQPFDFTPQGSFGKAEAVYQAAMQAAQGQAKGGGGGGGGSKGASGSPSGDQGDNNKGKTEENKGATETPVKAADNQVIEGSTVNPVQTNTAANPTSDDKKVASADVNPAQPPLSGAKGDGNGTGPNDGKDSKDKPGSDPKIPSSVADASAAANGAADKIASAVAAAANKSMPNVGLQACASGQAPVGLTPGMPSASVNGGASGGVGSSLGSQSGTADAANKACTPGGGTGGTPNIMVAANIGGNGGDTGAPPTADAGTVAHSVSGKLADKDTDTA